MKLSGIIIIACAITYTITIVLVSYNIGMYYGGIDSMVKGASSETAVEEIEIPQNPPASSVPEFRNEFTVKEHSGRVVVLKNGEIIEQLSIDVTLLPAESRRLLKQGINAYSQEELAEILEDYAN